jgi:hypothetical protein
MERIMPSDSRCAALSLVRSLPAIGGVGDRLPIERAGDGVGGWQFSDPATHARTL